jgi:hypothetical protein
MAKTRTARINVENLENMIGHCIVNHDHQGEYQLRILARSNGICLDEGNVIAERDNYQRFLDDLFQADAAAMLAAEKADWEAGNVE